MCFLMSSPVNSNMSSQLAVSPWRDHGNCLVCALSWLCCKAVCAGSHGIPSSLGVGRDHLDQHPSEHAAGTGERMSRASAWC